MHNPRQKSPEVSPALLERSMLPLWRQIYQEFTLRGQKWGLPLNVSMTLAHLYMHPEEAEPSHLAEMTFFPRQTMTSVLDTLEKRKLALRTPHPHDRRRKLIALTPPGRRLGRRIIQDMLEFEHAALKTIPEDSKVAFRELVSRYADALTSQNPSLHSI